MFRRFVVRKRITFDSSRTPKPNEVFTMPELSKPSEQDVAVAARWLDKKEEGKGLGEGQAGRDEGESGGQRDEEEPDEFRYWDSEGSSGDGTDEDGS